MENWSQLPLVNKTVIKRNVKNGKYDAIVLSPDPNMEFFVLFSELDNESAKHNRTGHPYQYPVFYPSIRQRCINCKHLGVIFFKNETVADNFVRRLGVHYSLLFGYFCKNDEYIANNIILNTMSLNGLDVISLNRMLGWNGICSSNSDYYRRSTGSGIFNSPRDVFLLIYFLIAGVVLLFL